MHYQNMMVVSMSGPLDSDFIITGLISKRKLTYLLLSIMLISLFLTLHILLYDSTIYSIQAATIISNNKNLPTKHTILPRTKTQPKLYPHHIHFPRTSRKLPQALIIGVRKCGTRALLEMLNLHPRIQKSAGEVHFFDRDENYLKGLEWYRRKMPHSFKGQITIEKSPSYFVTPEVAERVRAMNSSIKLLLIVREPVTRAISDFTQLRSHSTAVLPTNQQQQSTQNLLPSAPTSNTKTFEELAILPNGTVNINYRPLALSIYHQYTLRWLEVFSRSQLLIINGDTLINNPMSQINRVQDFLGIERRINRHNFYFNETKGFYCLRTESGDKKCLKETKGRAHPKVDEKSISQLRKFFVEHNQRFYELIGEDLGWPEV